MFDDDIFSLTDDVIAVTIGGSSYRAVIRRASQAEQQTLHGVAETNVTVFTIEPTASPGVGGTVTFDSIDYRIISAELRAHGTRWAVITTTDPAPTPPTARPETIKVVSIATANTEYSVDLGTPLAVQFRCRDNTSVIRWALNTGHVATPTNPYHTLQARGSQSLSFDGSTAVSIYAASSTGSIDLEILSH